MWLWGKLFASRGLAKTQTAVAKKVSTSRKSNKDDNKIKTKKQKVYMNTRSYMVAVLPK